MTPPAPLPPPPEPGPGQVVTLEQAKRWVTSGLQRVSQPMNRQGAEKAVFKELDAKWPKG